MIYQNFDLEIICPHGGDRLCARVLESPQGDCPFIDVKWPFDADEENTLLSEIYGGLRQRRGRSSTASTIQDYGGKLFEAVFSGDIEHLFRSSLDTASRAGKGLRIRLRLPEDSELHVRPWEFLFDTESREFLAVREHTPLVRYLPVAQPIAPITVEGPLRILVALSSPTDHPRLDTAREWEILLNALQPSIDAGQLELRRVPGHCTFDNLRDSLRHYRAHIFHFVGHGIPGALVLEQESGKGLEMEATHLRSAFPHGALPRLIVLNACSGAITQDVPFSGLAQGFLRQGVPAVVAMQASITDDAALIFTRYFYRDLIEIGAVDASLTEARLRMQGNGHPMEWGTPVLFMRALSGQLFQPTSIPAAGPAVKPDQRQQPREIAATPDASRFRVDIALPVTSMEDTAPIRPEPVANEHDFRSKDRPRAPTPPFSREREHEQSIPGNAGGPKDAAPAPPKAPAQAPRPRRLLVYGAATGLLGIALVVANGGSKVSTPGESTAPRIPASTASKSRPASDAVPATRLASPVTPPPSEKSTAPAIPAAAPAATSASTASKSPAPDASPETTPAPTVTPPPSEESAAPAIPAAAPAATSASNRPAPDAPPDTTPAPTATPPPSEESTAPAIPATVPAATSATSPASASSNGPASDTSSETTSAPGVTPAAIPSGDQAGDGSDVYTKVPETKPKAPTRTSDEVKRTPAAAADNCNNPVASERDASCVSK